MSQRSQTLPIRPSVGIKLREQRPSLRVGVECVEVSQEAGDGLVARGGEGDQALEGRLMSTELVPSSRRQTYNVSLVLLKELLIQLHRTCGLAKRLELEPEEDINARRLGEPRLEGADLGLPSDIDSIPKATHIRQADLPEVEGRDG